MAMNYSTVIDFPKKRHYTVQEVYKSFLNQHKRNSENTSSSYDKRVREFFKLVLGKDIERVTLDDIQSIENMDVQNQYVEKLIKHGNTGNTIATKLHSVKSFFDELLKNNMQVNPMVLKVRIKKDIKHTEALSAEELIGLYEFLKTEKDGLEKYLLAKTLFHTANRKTATLNMKWKESFVQRKDSISGEMIWVIRVLDKGKQWKEKPISDEFYKELQQLNHGQEMVFPVLSKPNMYKRYERSVKKYGKKINKNISFHTMKATSITIGWQMTKDMNLCKQLGGHAKASTTEIYINQEKALTNQLSYGLSKDIDEQILDKLSHEELINFIHENEDIKTMIVLRLNRELS